MKIAQLKDLIKDMPEDMEVLLAEYEHKTGKTILRYTNQCCNIEYQKKNNEFWLYGGMIK